MKGALYVVGGPIGNLEDITFRAVRILREVDAILCEDTRRSKILLERYGIDKPLISYHEHNELRRSKEVKARIEKGETFALLSDAGTPLISDPGYRLVRALREAQIPVYAVPGPSAVTAALSVCGLPTDRFVFEGYLPKRKGKRLKRLEGLKEEERTIVIFESVHRIERTLMELEEVFGEREMVLLRELTKIHEEVLSGTPREVREQLKEVRGEFVLVVKGKEKARR
jgi:16S rRNA (cytidine1402-2'-O)-methyltransferase